MRRPRLKSLSDYGLEVDQEVRFRRKSKGTWHEAKVKLVEKDDSVRLWATGTRPKPVNIYPTPETLEIKGRGPKGGVVWIPYGDHQ